MVSLLQAWRGRVRFGRHGVVMSGWPWLGEPGPGWSVAVRRAWLAWMARSVSRGQARPGLRGLPGQGAAGLAGDQGWVGTDLTGIAWPVRLGKGWCVGADWLGSQGDMGRGSPGWAGTAWPGRSLVGPRCAGCLGARSARSGRCVMVG